MFSKHPVDGDLRYPIGEFVDPGTLRPDERTAAIASIASTPGHLQRAVEGLDDEQLDTPYRPDGWRVRQVVHHLVDSHTNSFLRFKLGLTEDHPTILVYNEKAFAELPDHRGPVEPALELLTQLHGRWAGLLGALPDSAWERTIDHPEMGDMRLDSLLALYAWHGPHHVAHLTSLRQRKGW